jgi:hypothetical protein
LRLALVRGPGVAAVAALLSACGAASAQHGATASRSGSAAPRPPRISAALKAQEQAIHRQVLAALHAPAPANLAPGIPAVLRRASHRVNRIVTATPQHPQLAIEGNGVWLSLAHGRSLATAYGPYIPRSIQGTAARQTPATLLFTLTRTRGAVTLAPHDFAIRDELGDVIVPRIEVIGGGKLPARLASGHSMSLRMSAVLPVGNGQLDYSPTGNPAGKLRPLAAWDFDIETD